MILNSFRFNPTSPDFNVYSMIFDGVDEAIIFPDDAAYASTLKHSISVWFKCTTLNSGTTYLFDTGNQRLGFIQSGSQLRYQFTKSPTQDDIRISGLTITDGQWHHILATFDGSTQIAQVFYDGVLVNTKNPTNNVSTNPQLYNGIGAVYLGSSRFFNGSIDEVAFWHDTDQSANISSIYNCGAPGDLSTLPTPPTNYVRMGDGATWDGINWNLPDLGVMNGSPVSRNMEQTDRQADVPSSIFNCKSLAFDGVDEYVDCGNILDKDGTTPFSISAWIKCPSDVGIVPIASRKKCRNSGSGRYAGYEFVLTTSGLSKNKLTFEIEGLNSSGASSGAITRKGLGFDFNDDVWHHVVVTYDGSEDVSGIKLYKDGAEWTTFATYQDLSNNFIGPIAPDPTVPFCIGGDLSNSNCDSAVRSFIGNIDEVSFFDSELDASQVTAIFNSGEPNTITGAAAYWRMGENSTYQTPQILMPENTNKDKVSNYSLSFDGVDDYVDTGITTTGTNDVTVCCWIKTTSTYVYTASQCAFGGRNAGSGDNYTLGRLGSDFSTPNDTVVRVFNTLGKTKLNDGNWHFIAYTHDYTTKETKAYVDGNTTPEATATFPGFSTGFVISIGNNGLGFYFAGNVDECAYFNSVLTGSELNSIYNSGTPTTISGATAYWKLGEQARFSTNWTVPDQVGSSDGTSANMTIEDRVGDAPNSSNNAVSFNMEEADISNDTP